ncbi:hypothetical protein B9Z55_028225 [Caenorhabditis nigoni]|uniref:Uncharacterized protein n=1 Tax=Caenorhabditis nigoni TaxID=1611254 RepID=A0A2G5SCC3_9PELO|nr:hypothetical protein B9Z55_028225 [Caenorhabditis nigoni]
MDEPFNNGPDGSRVQTPDDQYHDADNIYKRIYKRRCNKTAELSTTNDITRRMISNEQFLFSGTTSMPNVQTATNTTNHSNATNSTVDRLANKITILDLENKYGESIELLGGSGKSQELGKKSQGKARRVDFEKKTLSKFIQLGLLHTSYL